MCALEHATIVSNRSTVLSTFENPVELWDTFKLDTPSRKGVHWKASEVKDNYREGSRFEDIAGGWLAGRLQANLPRTTQIKLILSNSS